MLNWVVDRVYYIAQRQNQSQMLGGTPIVSTSRDGKEIPSLKIIENNESSVNNEAGELESEVIFNLRESRIEEALGNQDTLRLNTDLPYADDDLDVREDAEPNENTEAQDKIGKETYNNRNLPLEQQVNMLRRS